MTVRCLGLARRAYGYGHMDGSSGNARIADAALDTWIAGVLRHMPDLCQAADLDAARTEGRREGLAEAVLVLRERASSYTCSLPREDGERYARCLYAAADALEALSKDGWR